jgi:hypothetical protein
VERGMGGPWTRKGWFELSLSQGVNNPQTLAMEKEAQRKTGMFNLKHSIKLYMF